MESFMEVDSMPELKDIHVDQNSIKPSTPIVDTQLEGEITAIGTIPVPIISNIESMINMLEEYQDDTRFIMNIIRASEINYSPTQRALVDRIEQEYEAWINTEVNLFDDYVIQLREDLIHQESRVSDFFEDQIRIYAGIYRALTRVPFPYSDKQLNLLESFNSEIEWATGDPTRMADIALIEDLQCFLRLMETGDHATTNKFYVNCTIEYYVQEIVDELFYFEHEETTRRIPDCVPEGTLVNLATFMREQLVSSFNGCHYETHINLFHLGLSEIYNRLVGIFELYELSLSAQQKNLLSLVKRDIGNALREQSMGKYQDLHLGWYGFMDSLRREHPELETKIEEGFRIVDQEGSIAKTVQKIMLELEELKEVAEHHHHSFYDYSSSIPEITKIILHYLTRIYPLDHSEPITVLLTNGFYASAISEEWIQQQNERNH